jgi:REP element-mobilizing transposase RayT
MGGSKSNPGNANLPIGVSRPANREIGVPGEKRTLWHSRGYLPHFESPEATQHVTFHLADSLPQSVLQRLEEELKTLPAEKRSVERRKRVDAWMDAGHGSCVLREAGVAEMVQGSLLGFDGARYRLLAWVVMPNHVHVLFEPIGGWSVAEIVAGWKKFTARKICDFRRAGGAAALGPVWHREYWDRFIRDRGHFEDVVEYIRMNPVKAGLVREAHEWRWGSAWFGGCQDLANPDFANREIGVPGGKP